MCPLGASRRIEGVFDGFNEQRHFIVKDFQEICQHFIQGMVPPNNNLIFLLILSRPPLALLCMPIGASMFSSVDRVGNSSLDGWFVCYVAPVTLTSM